MAIVLAVGIVLGLAAGTLISSFQVNSLNAKLTEVSGRATAAESLKGQISDLKLQLEKLNVNELYGLVKAGDKAKAYGIGDLNKMPPIIANDYVGQTPVVVSWCPLCNTLTAYERALPGDIIANGKTISKGTVLTFREAGARKIPGTDIDNLHFKDDETGSLWAQGPGMAVEGPAKGQELRTLPIQLFNKGVIAKMGAPVWGSS